MSRFPFVRVAIFGLLLLGGLFWAVLSWWPDADRPVQQREELRQRAVESGLRYREAADADDPQAESLHRQYQQDYDAYWHFLKAEEAP